VAGRIILFHNRPTLVGRFIIADENTLVKLPHPPTGNNASSAGGNAGNKGLLTRVFISSIISDNERARAAFANRRGATKTVNGTADTRRPLVVLLITDRRIVFASPDGDVPSDASLGYGEIATAGIETGRVNSVAIESVDSVQWTFRLPSADATTIDAVRRHLQWIEQVRQRFLEVRADIEMAAGVIRDHAESMDWEEALQQYRDTRDTLDRFISTLECTTPIENEVLAPQLTEIERTLEKAHVTLYIERARSELELGSYLIEHEDSGRPKEVLQRALRFYECATGQQDAVERGDAFEFGTQRTLKENIEKLGWEIEMVAAEPRRQAEEAKLKAQSTASIATAIEYWESALRRYEQALVLELGNHNRQFTGDPEELRTERDIAVEMLLDLCTEYSQSQWKKGLEQHAAGRIKAAIRCCETAISQLERACELAAEYDYPKPTHRDTRLSEWQKTVTAIRTGQFTLTEAEYSRPSSDSRTATGETSAESTSENGSLPVDGDEFDDDSVLWRSAERTADESAGEATEAGPEPLDVPSLDDIKALDTHSDITLTLADPTAENETDPHSDTLGDALRPPEPTDEPAPDESFEAFSDLFVNGEDAENTALKRTSDTD